MSESKHDKFKRLAEQRGNRILHYLRLLTNLSNRSNYEYTDADVRAMLTPIEQQLRSVKLSFSNKPNKIRL